VVRALDLRLDGREFDSRPPRLVLGWVTVFGRANHLGISQSHLGQLSLLPSAGREMNTGQSAVTLCGWGVKTGWLFPYADKRVDGSYGVRIRVSVTLGLRLVSLVRICGWSGTIGSWNGKGKGKEVYLYSAILVRTHTHKALRHGPHSFTCKQHHACLSFVSVHQMAPSQLRQQTSNCSFTTHLSTPKGWKAELAWLVDIQRMAYPHNFSTDRAQDSESSPAKDRRSTAGPRKQMVRWCRWNNKRTYELQAYTPWMIACCKSYVLIYDIENLFATRVNLTVWFLVQFQRANLSALDTSIVLSHTLIIFIHRNTIPVANNKKEKKT